MSKQKLAFIYPHKGDKFLGDIRDYLSEEYEVKSLTSGMLYDMYQLLDWCDISWFEWCSPLLIHATKTYYCCRIICRLHSYEAMTNVPSRVQWSNDDDLIFVAPHIRDILKLQIPDIEQYVKTRIIPNGVNMDKFTFKSREKGFNLAYVGYINYKKAPALLLQCLKHLVDIDPRYVLHIAGRFQDLRYQVYFDHIIKEMDLDANIIFHGWVENINDWLQDKHYIVCTSLLESFGYGIAESMACGLKPVLHNFVGATQIYSEKYLFNTVTEFAEMVMDDEYNPGEYRQLIEDHYPLGLQLAAIDELLSPPQTESAPIEERSAQIE